MNKNSIPFETESPFVTSGIRVGTAAVTTRGFDEEAMVKVGELIAKVLHHLNEQAILDEIQAEVMSFMQNYPLYEDM
ncbi:serine hydroxymethyltransferase [Listeria aquatica FSL S10-1188]|uniref:Serine hydroxymethyltransferase n=1 Tax=Listeria aquatica FSL S10-1188 TaxID=1265818 RepID=W7ASR6_9LIST|nr:serine hydroxymethyltransferase [Listeria aquatica FSL S10-1188]